MYTQSSLRTLVKVAQAISSNPEYMDLIMESYGMEKEAGRRFDGKKNKDLFNKTKQSTRDAQTMPILQARALQEAGEDIEMLPVKGKPGHVMVVHKDNAMAQEAAKDVRKELQNQSAASRASMAGANDKAFAEAEAKLDRVPQKQPAKKRNQKAQNVLDGRTNRQIVKDEKGLIGGPSGAGRKELTDPIKGGTYAKLKGNKPVRNADGTVMRTREYVSPKTYRDTLAKYNRTVRQLANDRNKYFNDLAAKDKTIAGWVDRANGYLRENAGLKGSLAAANKGLAAQGRMAASGRDRVRGLVKLLRRANRRAGIFGAAAGAGGLALGAAGGFFGGRASAPEAAPGVSQEEVAALLAGQQAANDRLSTYGNIGMAGGATVGGLTGYGVANALGGGTATKLLLSALGAFSGGYGGKKLGEYLA